MAKKNSGESPIMDYSGLDRGDGAILLLAGILVGYFVFRLVGAMRTWGIPLADAMARFKPWMLLGTEALDLSIQSAGAGLLSGFVTTAALSVAMESSKPAAQKAYGSARWHKPEETYKYRAGNGKSPLGNIIFTQTEWFSHNNSVTGRNRNIMMIGRPGTGKSRYFFKPNILNAEGTIICTDPKGELLRDCGKSLLDRGYDIKVLDLCDMWKSDRYNPLSYVRKVPKESLSPEQLQMLEDEGKDPNDMLAEEDVMTLINTIFKNTKGDLDSTSGDPFWEKAEMVYDQALIYYVLFRCPKPERNFRKVLELMRLSAPTDEDAAESKLDEYFEKWEAEEPDSIGVKQYGHYKTARGKTVSSILMSAQSRLAPMNIREVDELISTDTMELDRIGMPTDPEALKRAGMRPDQHGKVAYFIITDPGNDTFNFLANIMYTQIFSIINTNAKKFGGSLPTNVDLFMDEWAQLGEIPRFLEELAYVRGLNVGIVIAIQSLDQLKRRYKEAWQQALDCCDYILFLGSSAKETLEYISSTYLGKATLRKSSRSYSRSKTDSTSRSYDELGRELATVDELGRLQKGECVLWVAQIGAFYSKLFDLKKHPRYGSLYESWEDKRDAQGRPLTPAMHARMYDHYETIKRSSERIRTENILRAAGFDPKFIKEKPEPERIWSLV